MIPSSFVRSLAKQSRTALGSEVLTEDSYLKWRPRKGESINCEEKMADSGMPWESWFKSWSLAHQLYIRGRDRRNMIA